MATKKVVKKAATKAAARKTTSRKTAPRKPIERKGVMELAGKPATIIGADVKVGQRAPGFTAQVGTWAGLNTWAEVDVLKATAGKVRILAAVPSLSTNTCDAETRRFNEEAASLGDDIRVITISADLPPTQKHWCAAAGVERVYTVSDHMTLDFGTKYATHMKERRWHRRAVFVVGKDDKLAYVAYMPQLGEQPNYEEVIGVARRLAA
jgi:thiol peroxidase